MDITTITKHKNTLIAILIAFLLWAFPAPLYQLWLGLSYVFSYFSYLLPTLYFLEKIALVLAVIAAGFYSYQYYQLANAQTKTKELQDNRKRAYNFAFAIGSFTLLYLIIIRPVARSTAAQLLLTHLLRYLPTQQLCDVQFFQLFQVCYRQILILTLWLY